MVGRFWVMIYLGRVIDCLFFYFYFSFLKLLLSRWPGLVAFAAVTRVLYHSRILQWADDSEDWVWGVPVLSLMVCVLLGKGVPYLLGFWASAYNTPWTTGSVIVGVALAHVLSCPFAKVSEHHDATASHFFVTQLNKWRLKSDQKIFKDKINLSLYLIPCVLSLSLIEIFCGDEGMVCSGARGLDCNTVCIRVVEPCRAKCSGTFANGQCLFSAAFSKSSLLRGLAGGLWSNRMLMPSSKIYPFLSRLTRSHPYTWRIKRPTLDSISESQLFWWGSRLRMLDSVTRAWVVGSRCGSGPHRIQFESGERAEGKTPYGKN